MDNTEISEEALRCSALAVASFFLEGPVSADDVERIASDHEPLCRLIAYQLANHELIEEQLMAQAAVEEEKRRLDFYDN